MNTLFLVAPQLLTLIAYRSRRKSQGEKGVPFMILAPPHVVRRHVGCPKRLTNGCITSVMANCRLVLPARRLAARANVLPPTISLRAAKSEGMLTARAAPRILFLRVYPVSLPILTLMSSFSSYVAALELRVEKLERRLAYARSRKASVAMHDPDSRLASDAERKDSLATIRAAIHRKAARKRENSDVNSLVSDFGYL